MLLRQWNILISRIILYTGGHELLTDIQLTGQEMHVVTIGF
jgi:hypothetical protein